MFEIYFLWVLALIWVIFAVVQDLRTTEIYNWLNFSLIIFALGFRFFYSLFELGNFSFFYQGLLGLGVFFLIGNLFYYIKLFAGGDYKLFVALGTILPLSYDLLINLKLFLIFIFAFLVVGSVYALFVTVYFGIKNFSLFKKEFILQIEENRSSIKLFLIFSLISLILSYLFENLFFLGGILFVVPYFYFGVKSVDKSCMVRNVSVAKLMEGDWLYEDIQIGKKRIKANWDGLTKEEIRLIRKYRKKIWVHYGVQFAPVFLISFICFIVFTFFNYLN